MSERQIPSLGVMTVNEPTRPKSDVARLGDEIYQRDIRSKVETDHHGEIVSIDVDSGDYAVGRSVVAAAGELRTRRPEARVWSVRVGYPALRHFGGRPLRSGQ